jgi:hypothetical protein
MGKIKKSTEKQNTQPKPTEQEKPPTSGLEKWIPATVVVAIITAVAYILVALINRSTAITTTLKPIEFTQTAEAFHTSVVMTNQAVDVLNTSIVMTTQAYAHIVADSSTATLTPTLFPTSTYTPIFTPTLEVEELIVQLIANYYDCINNANPDLPDDYRECWDLLSDRPGEFQENLNRSKGGLLAFTDFWKDFKVNYRLFYCSKGLERFVETEYYLYKHSDLAVPIGRFYLEYSFALDEKGWRIKSADDSIHEIDSYCESQPRIEKMTTPP